MSELQCGKEILCLAEAEAAAKESKNLVRRGAVDPETAVEMRICAEKLIHDLNELANN